MKKVLGEFKGFLMRGNLIELAVAFVMAAAFGGLVNVFIDSLINPIVGAIFGQPSFSSLTIGLWADATLYYGAFLTELITFVSIAATVFFFIVKPYNAFKARHKEEEAPPPPPEDDESVVLLREIRDALSK